MNSSLVLNEQISIDAVCFSFIAGTYISMPIFLPLVQMMIGTPSMKALLALSIGAYWLVDQWPRLRPLQNVLKTGLIFAAIAITVLLPTLAIIIQRGQSEPQRLAHDGLIQSEAATAFVLKGLNPYVEDYRATPLAQLPFSVGDLKVNPALDYYAYLPLTFLIPLPFQAAANVITAGWFDHRSVYLLFFVATLIVGSRLTRDPTKRLLLLMAVGLNPMFVPFFIEGRNDVLVLFEICLTLLLMQRRHINWSAVVLALACATKQVGWFMVPFYLVYASGEGTLRERWMQVRWPLLILLAVGGGILLPWLMMSPSAFLGDIFYFQSGLSARSFPISGISFGMLLWTDGWLKSNVTSFPFWLVQLSISLPLALILLRRQARQRSAVTVPMYAGLVMFAFGFFSQFFHDNYLGFIIMLLVIGVLSDKPQTI